VRNSRPGTALRCAGILAVCLGPVSFGLAAPRDQVELLQHPLTCTFRTVQAGQFHDTDFASGPSGGLSVVTIAASPADLHLERAAVIEDDHAAVADLVAQDKQLVLVAIEPGEAATVISLFTAARKGPLVPAALSRQSLIGSIPVVIQSAGTCTGR
jgi:hypothetical protein